MKDAKGNTTTTTNTTTSASKAEEGILSQQPTTTNEIVRDNDNEKSLQKKVICMKFLEWSGQTAASLCWIISVFAYGISSAGDRLQLAAACCWFVANLASALVYHLE